MYVIAFWLLAIACLILTVLGKSQRGSPKVGDAAFGQFQRSYLVVYLLAVAGDWLQGAHVYALYQSYGMSKHQIEILFVAGFGSSMLFGTFVGSVADKYGRRWNCLLYGILYAASCATKHVPDMRVLLIGRVLGGMATSILYSAFESWLVHEHHKRGFDDERLGNIFSHAGLGNGLVAIVSGVVAQFVADRYGFVAPFDVSAILLCLMCAVIALSWSENYGDAHAPVVDTFRRAIDTIFNDRRVLYLGLVQALFEGSMYTFVLEWTPALSKAEGGNPLPHGYIFAAFMASAMLGSSLFPVLCRFSSPDSFMRAVLLISAVCLAVPIIVPDSAFFIFSAFLVFEACVGIFWPAMGYLRSIHLPEETRSTTINLFRVLLNFIVIVVLLQNIPMLTIFRFCSCLLLSAAGAQHLMYRAASNRGDKVQLHGIETNQPGDSPKQEL